MWISLVGFHACGKTTVAREVARLGGQRVVDLDGDVGLWGDRFLVPPLAIDDIAASDDLQAQVLTSLATTGPVVVATAAGTLERARTATILRQRSVVVWLDAPWPVVRRRLAPFGDGAPAPVWQQLGEEGLLAHYRRWRPVYAAAARLRLDARLAPAVLAQRLLGRCWSLPSSGEAATS